MIDVALNFDQVSRIYPRDISDTPSAILREMFSPHSLLETPTSGSFFALRDINFSLCKGQKLGVIGTHRSGKTTLAGLASGILQPTGGRVTAQGARLLISRPTAGFKMTLTSIENLRLRASLAGLHGELLNTVLDRTLSRCGVGDLEARTPMGNLSPYIVKQLGLQLLLELPADILVVDEISSAGAGDARWFTRGLLQEKIDASTALIISSDLSFIQEVVEDAILLHHGRLYGPFRIERAIDHFNELPEEGSISESVMSLYDPLNPPKVTYQLARSFITASSKSDLFDGLSGASSSDEDYQESLVGKGKPEIKKIWSPVAELVRISVDGMPYSHTSFSLIRGASNVLNLELTLLFKRCCAISDFEFCLHPEFGEELARTRIPAIQSQFLEKSTCKLSLSLEIPDIPKGSYGLSMTPIESGGHRALKDRMKVLKFGITGRPAEQHGVVMKITNLLTSALGT